MLPAHAYPLLKQYPHLKGNFGTAWQNQQKEFDGEYPDEAAIERSAIMQYFDADASKRINQMWINVRCYNIKDVTPQVWTIVVILVNDGKSITNEMIYGEIHGTKKDEDGKALAGATIGLFFTDGTEPILTTVSAEDGSFAFTGIPYGEYVVREIAAPEGYVMDDTPYTVKVDQNGEDSQYWNHLQKLPQSL